MWDLYEVEYVAYDSDGEELPGGYYRTIAVPSDIATAEIAISAVRDQVIGQAVKVEPQIKIGRIEIESVNFKGTLHYIAQVSGQPDPPAREDGLPSVRALQIAGQIWCDPAVSDRTMDPDLAMVFAKRLNEYIDALEWCEETADFHGRPAWRRGWEKRIKPLLGAT